MELKCRTFDELTNRELYSILQARAQVFVVEQECAYQDLDGLDYDSIHIFYEEEGRIMAYMSALEIGDSTVKIRRVLTMERSKGLGKSIMEEGMRIIEERFHPETMVLEAQSYAVGFYEGLGFTVSSEEFLLDGIPHKCMQKSLR